MTHAAQSPVPFQSVKSGALKGTAAIPGDKSVSHRSLMFGGIAKERTVIHGLLEGEDVLNTAAAMRAMGATIEKHDDGTWSVEGVGIGNLKSPAAPMEMGNSGTSTRLLAGLVAGHGISASFTGDASLTKRPMGRIITPLEQMGASFDASEGGRLPMTVHGAREVKAIEYKLPVASAQVKSAVMLAGLRADGVTTVIETKPTRDHTENMLRHFGVTVDVEDLDNGAQAVHLKGGQDMIAAGDIFVPRDPSSAAFPAVAAALCAGSDVLLPNIGMNPRRNGIFLCLKEMGADIAFENERIEAGEPVADIRVRGTKMLQGITVPEERVPSMIDEFPVLFVAASFASGITRCTGLDELRVKESDRLAVMAKGLEACGVKLEMGEDSLTIFGNGTPPQGGATIETALDHRIAMSFLIMGLAAQTPVIIDDIAPVATSFPNFVALMNGLSGGESLKAL
ncbi:MAG: 3-phosphoshikimate 1-carboxyvinyltransferase [Micavibrio aeruginosavorus]|uniref:3-phosphoshikimate 1-carboxyvinyltransferase n=1 Tax=Micavibrio aeruginosavorus TaxID=349221 RepID=A0A2W5C0S1_9BACT|nr:MAG: 3-phosphoshikimate 1-carboxyvinyltransferase [Micavibrio aeruginosavorus]